MTSEELRKLADDLIEWGNVPPVVGVHIHDFSRTHERLQRENAEAERLLKRAKHCVATVRYNSGHNSGLEDAIDSYLSRTARHEGT